MKYDLLWSMDEYQALLDYKWNSFKYINMFLTDEITNRERNYRPDARYNPKTPEEFKKAIGTIIFLYQAIKKNYVLNGSKEYQRQLFRGVRKNSQHLYFTSTSESIDLALTYIDGFDSGDTLNDVLMGIQPSQVPWIDLEVFMPASKGGDLEEKEILFLPCEYQVQGEMNFIEYLNKSGTKYNLSRETQMRLARLKDLTFRDVKLVSPSYDVFVYPPLDALAARFEGYRQNLIRLAEAARNGQDTTQIIKEIIEFKKDCWAFIRSRFRAIDDELEQLATRELPDESIRVDDTSKVQEVYIGNTGRMFSVQSSEGDKEYYFKPAESKDRVEKSYRAYIQEAAYNLQRIINPSRAVKCNTCTINGTFGAIQEKIDIDIEATRQFRRSFYTSDSKLSPELLSQILDEYLVDYCLCNYDAHASNFIVDSDGNLRGIDKEQSFRYIDKDQSDDMLFSENYNEMYGESETIYATIFKKIARGEISYKVLEGLNYRAARLAQISDQEYRQMFKDYAYSKTKDPQEAEALLDRIVKRKQDIVTKVDELKQYLASKSYGKRTSDDEYIFTDTVASSSRPMFRPRLSDSVEKIAILRDEKQHLSEMKEQLEEYQSQQTKTDGDTKRSL